MILADEAATAGLGARLASLLQPGDVVTLSGPLGVGKSALARAVISALGHQGDVPSPTFAIVQPYETLQPPLWHVDLYRLDSPKELAELGLEEAVEAVLLVEWPERAGPDAFPQALRLELEFGQQAERILTAELPPSWQDRWPAQ
jgi:tRNA threonylcarbamoyladenosine biosynthesis protein TsaE